MKRACKISLKFITESKRQKIASLLEAYQGAVNFYIGSLWNNPGKLDKATLARLQNTRLSERYKSQALKQAIEIVKGTRKGAKELGVEPSKPRFEGGAILDAKFVDIQQGKGSFDLVIKLSTLQKRKPILLPAKKTAVLNKWLGNATAKLIQGCELRENYLIVWVECVDAEKPSNPETTIGFDIGKLKMLSDSDGGHHGVVFSDLIDKVARKETGSQGERRARQERDHYIGQVLNQLDWSSMSVIGIEKLKDVKRGKRKNRSKAFRKALAPWTYRLVVQRIKEKAQQNRVRVVEVDPRNSSRECPACNTVSKSSRKGECFKCVNCDYTNDADTVGALNILARTLPLVGCVESPMLPN